MQFFVFLSFLDPLPSLHQRPTRRPFSSFCCLFPPSSTANSQKNRQDVATLHKQTLRVGGSASLWVGHVGVSRAHDFSPHRHHCQTTHVEPNTCKLDKVMEWQPLTWWLSFVASLPTGVSVSARELIMLVGRVRWLAFQLKEIDMFHPSVCMWEDKTNFGWETKPESVCLPGNYRRKTEDSHFCLCLH